MQVNSPSGGTNLPLQQHITTRDGTLATDAKMVNCFIEASEGKNACVKRPGLTLAVQLPPGIAQGQFMCNGIAYCIINDIVYDTFTGMPYPIPLVTSPGQQYQCLSDAPYGTTVFKSLSGLWFFTALTIAKVTDVNYPALTSPGVAYLDGYYFVLGSDGTVRSSNLQDVTTWPALNFIGPDASLGTGACITRHLNYIVVIMTQGLQLYYDAGISPGNPLSPATNASWKTGTPSGTSVVDLQDNMLFISTTATYGRTVSLLDGGLGLSEISNPFISRILNRSNMVAVTSFAIKTAGHGFYIVTMPDIGITLAYDLTYREWYQWTSSISGVETYFQPQNYLNNTSRDLLQDPTSGAVYYMNPLSYQDYGNPINVLVRTDIFTFGSMKTKFFDSVMMDADYIQTTCAIRYSDTDYQTFSNYGTINMASDRKQFRNLGKSRQRAIDILHTDNTPFKAYSLLFEVRLGSS